MDVVTDSAKRVPEHTATDVNLAIADRTKQSIAYFDDHREHSPAPLPELCRAGPPLKCAIVLNADSCTKRGW